MDYQGFSRELTDADVQELRSAWGQQLGLELSAREIVYLAERALTLEAICHGRIGTSIQDMVVRVLVALAALDQSDVVVRGAHLVEIGLMFGISLGALYDACVGRAKRVFVTGIDPMTGYYGDEKRDPVTGAAVSLGVVNRNMEFMHIPKDRMGIIVERSASAVEEVASLEREIDMLIIDGDHSYEAVKADYDLYSPLMRPGGFIVFDDYGVDEWPDVSACVDEEVVGSPGVELVRSGWRSAVFRITK